jgi:hypothetical protein
MIDWQPTSRGVTDALAMSSVARLTVLESLADTSVEVTLDELVVGMEFFIKCDGGFISFTFNRATKRITSEKQIRPAGKIARFDFLD